MAALPAAALPVPAGAQSATPPASDKIEFTTVTPGEAARPVPRFFSEDQFKALQRLADILMPSFNERPGAKEARVAEFLDFLISESPADRQELYRAGLDHLNAQARKAHNQPFAAILDQQTSPILKPLTSAWTYDGPTDSFARFLVAAKEDVLRATYNARGNGYYWVRIE
jgi:hypothetical protein